MNRFFANIESAGAILLALIWCLRLFMLGRLFIPHQMLLISIFVRLDLDNLLGKERLGSSISLIPSFWSLSF